MRIVRRGNFTLDLEGEPDNESRLLDAEAEWAAQWEPTIHRIQATVQDAHNTTVPRAEMEVVISLRPQQALKIRIVA